MKKLNTLIFMICFTTLSFGQNATKTDKSKIEQLVIESFDEIWSKLDSKNIDKYYTKDFLLLENGEIWTNATIANYLDKALLDKPIPKRVNSIEIIEVKILNGMAWVAYKNHAVFSFEDKTSKKVYWLESATAILTKNGWKLEMLHSTRAKDE
ncbi:DUF4440 domain-containing protein [Flavobacterium sp. 2]|uniref:DUF4440 domain-containing protein n=1 Tax=Flavobacterium sp. 2 TaxID=308053 RepID=UPI003CEEE879